MVSHKKIIIILIILLALFVGLAVLRWVLTNLALSDQEKYLAGLTGPTVENSLSAPIVQASDPWQGSDKAKVTIVVFESYTCSHCAEQNAVLTKLLENSGNKVKLVWKDFMGPSAQTALRASVAARCAQGQGKFWEFHDALFNNQLGLSDSLYKDLAVQLKLNQDQFNQCFEAQATLSSVQNSYNEGLALGVDGTPYLFVNDQRISGLVSLEELQNLVSQLD